MRKNNLQDDSEKYSTQDDTLTIPFLSKTQLPSERRRLWHTEQVKPTEKQPILPLHAQSFHPSPKCNVQKEAPQTPEANQTKQHAA